MITVCLCYVLYFAARPCVALRTPTSFAGFVRLLYLGDRTLEVATITEALYRRRVRHTRIRSDRLGSRPCSHLSARGASEAFNIYSICVFILLFCVNYMNKLTCGMCGRAAHAVTHGSLAWWHNLIHGPGFLLPHSSTFCYLVP